MKPAVAAIGTFDGVHPGHFAVINKLKEIAAAEDLEPLAISFDCHPLSIIAPERAPLAITSTNRKCELLLKAGIRPVILHFDEEMRRTTARDWMKRLRDEFGVRTLVVGYDNTFGSDGVTLSLADYRRYGEEIGMTVAEADFVPGVSSSAIRKALATGNVEEAASLLGRKYTLQGTVVTGNHLGRTIGFPTANITPEPGLTVPANGVYSAMATLPDGRRLKAVVNIGTRPTVRRGNTKTIEAHIIDWEGDLYGRTISLSFYNRLRDEERFNSIEALRRQIEKDKETAKVLLSAATKQA